MDCAEDEYDFHGECHKCRRCPPGQELHQDCGYGVGIGGVCVQCELRWFKGEWGSHSCRMCQTCRHLNRREKMPCTHTHNTVCGDCLPGFYSKKRLDGFQDPECLPCGTAPFRDTQCRTKGEVVEKAWGSVALPHDAVVITTACVVAVAMATVLFVMMVLIYKGFSSTRNIFKGCLSPPSNSCGDIATAPVSMEMEDTVTQVAEASGLSISTVTTPVPCPHQCRVVETLVCGVHTGGVISQATGSHDVYPGQSLSAGGMSFGGQCCVTEHEDTWGHHVPIECSELDLINVPPNLELKTPTYTHSSPIPETIREGREEEEETGKRERRDERSSCMGVTTTWLTL